MSAIEPRNCGRMRYLLLGLISCTRPFCNNVLLRLGVGRECECDTRKGGSLHIRKHLKYTHSDVNVRSQYRRSVGLCFSPHLQLQPVWSHTDLMSAVGHCASHSMVEEGNLPHNRVAGDPPKLGGPADKRLY